MCHSARLQYPAELQSQSVTKTDEPADEFWRSAPGFRRCGGHNALLYRGTCLDQPWIAQLRDNARECGGRFPLGHRRLNFVCDFLSQERKGETFPCQGIASRGETVA